jgi:hypothetical protein
MSAKRTNAAREQTNAGPPPEWDAHGDDADRAEEQESIANRQPPCDLDAEAAVLSAVLVDETALPKIQDKLKPTHFFSEAHSRIYEACLQVNGPVDPIIVCSTLRATGRLAQVGGTAYVTELLNAAPAVANIEAYARAVIDCARERELLLMCQLATAQIYSRQRPIAKITDDLRQTIERVEVARDETWVEPIRFDAFEVPAFPVDTLPPWAASWCGEEAVAMQVPIDLPAMLALATISVCVAGKAAVEIQRGWQEPTNLYTAVALAPGEGKSPVFKKATGALSEWEREQRASWTPKIAAANEERHLLEERQKGARKRALKPTPEGANAREEARELAVKLTEVQVPALPRLTADDATPEAVGRLLAEQRGRLGIFSSEGGPLAILAGRYSEGRANLELFCKAHSGDPYTLDRVGRPSIHLDSPLLTVALTVQPTVIAGLASTPEMRGQGLLARFLYAIPTSMVGRREADPRPVGLATIAAYNRAIHRLLNLETTSNAAGELEAHVIALAPDARNALIGLKARLEPRLLPGADLNLISDWANKLPGTVARIACALHVAERSGERAAPIDLRTMERAIAIGDYAIPHALAAFSVMGSDASTELAKRAWSWLRNRPESAVTKRELHRGLHVKHAADLDAPIAVLVERGYIREMPPRRTGGRPSPVYEINPLSKR